MRFSGLHLALFPARFTRLHTHFPSRLLSACALAAALTACGGGGSGPDRTPNSFSFTAQNNVELGTQVASPAVTITSISNNTPISIAGGEYSLNGGAFTSVAGTIDNNQALSVRATASDAFDTANTVTVTVGSVTASFVATTLAQDITPNAVSFTAITNAALSAEQTSNAITVEGINDAAPISIANGQYSINGGDFTAEAGTVEAGSSVVVQLLTSATFNTASTATLTIGELESAFSATTLLEDTTPDAISFAPATDAEFNAVVTSATQTISGINSPAAISIAGGQYKVNDNAFTSEAGTVNAGDVVVVSVVAGDTIDSETSATLTVGNINGIFSATTIGDTTPPVAEVFFPTPTTFTDGKNVTIRGAATDDFGPISQIRFIVSAGETTNDPVILEAAEGESLDTWMQSVPLITGQANTISIQAIDAAGNEQESAVELSITQGSEAVTFPEGSLEIIASDDIRGAFYDTFRNQIIIPNGYRDSDSLIGTSIETGMRSVFIDNSAGNVLPGSIVNDLILSANDENLAFIVGENASGSISRGGTLFKVDLATSGAAIDLLESNPIHALNDYVVQFDNDEILYINGGIFSGAQSFNTVNIETKEITNQVDAVAGDRVITFTYDPTTQRIIYLNGNDTIRILEIGAAEPLITSINLLQFLPSVNQFDEPFGYPEINLNTFSKSVLLNSDLDDTVLEIDLESFEVDVLFSVASQEGQPNIISNPKNIDFIGNQVAIVFETGFEPPEFQDGLSRRTTTTHYTVDLTTGERVVLSRFVVPE